MNSLEGESFGNGSLMGFGAVFGICLKYCSTDNKAIISPELGSWGVSGILDTFYLPDLMDTTIHHQG